MTEKDQLNFALTCKWIYGVFRIYHVGYNSPRWIPINFISTDGDLGAASSSLLAADGDRLDPNVPPAENYRDGVLVDGKLYLTILEEESPICWILDFDEGNPLCWTREKVTFVESISLFEDSNNEVLKPSEDYVEDNINVSIPKQLKSKYQPLRSTIATAISPIIYLFGGECLNTGEPSGTLYELNTKDMILSEVMGQGGDLPPARKMHSLNVINDSCLVLFGGRCNMNDVDNPREYDTRDFYIYDIPTKTWTSYRDSNVHVPYPRSYHSTTVINSSLYIYGGQQITSSSTPHSQIHDDEDLWCFTFSNNPVEIAEDSAEEGQKTPQSSSSSRSGASRISSSFQQERWQKLFSPRNFTSTAFSSGIRGVWHATTGKCVGRRRGAAMFSVGNRVAVLGGYERDNWKCCVNEITQLSDRIDGEYFERTPNEDEKSKSNNEQQESGTTFNFINKQKKHRGVVKEEIKERKHSKQEKPWELCKLYLPDKKRWDQVQIVDLPEMECVAITKDHTNRPFDVFVMGRRRGDTEEQGMIMGWIRELSSI
ncbi:18124_t:CDS:2 [Funneliformis geosporum]|uniref:16979_t:CDS:1 n=1 Tax=Funneliformis geosporum TaxID=1117311 RepID=A0A9W4SX61_9GLOM|nr:18124_t:CDS:2 [Funneliformis geosporum]CAI2183844.1 16979_t:CDS:2 [Funneliformis geosporum]